MPYITIEGGPLTTEQKKTLIEKLTVIAAETMQIPKDFFIVTIKELPDENIGIGGKTIDIMEDEYIRQHQIK